MYSIFSRIMLQLLCVLLLFNPVFADDQLCSLARDLAGQATRGWRQDQAGALKKLIKAQQMCPGDAKLTYNLGLGYLMYGAPQDALPYLEQAVARDATHADWLSNTATFLLQLEQQTERALQLAERAERLAADNPSIVDTLAQAQYAAGQTLAALASARKAGGMSGASSAVRGRYAELRDRFVNAQLDKIAAGEVESGLAQLKKLDNDPQTSRIYGETLLRLGRSAQALNHLAQAKLRFSAEPEISEAFDNAIAQRVQGFYQQFQNGDIKGALRDSKNLC